MQTWPSKAVNFLPFDKWSRAAAGRGDAACSGTKTSAGMTSSRSHCNAGEVIISI